MNYPRRQFLKTTAAGVGVVLLGSCRTASDSRPAAPKNFDPFATVPLGRSGLKVSRFCLGTGMKGGKRESNHTRMGKEKFERLIHEAYDRGTRLFDLADLYGTHPYVISALRDIRRDRFQITTKIWFRPGGIPEPERPDADVIVARFLKELRTDYIDLLLLHCVVSPKWPQELARQMEIIAKLKQKGVVRAHGVSCHSLAALEACATEPWVDSVHTRINPFGMSMDDKPEKVVPVLQRIHAAGKGVVGMKIIGEGRLRNDPEKRSESVRFTLGLGCVDVLNVGCESTTEIDDLSDRVRAVPQRV
ncbi:MAG: aldo/keto reductase [Verrucomicrobia bacterium]|nr:aldo/keto reductase [Verrucomicrobiota bacterium]